MLIKQFKKSIEDSVMKGIFSGLFTFSISFSFIEYLRADGFSIIEASFLPILPGIITFICILFFNTFLLNRSNKFLENKNTLKPYLSILIVLFFNIIIYLTIDIIMFNFDDSLPKDFAASLLKIAENNNESLDGIIEFSELPFSIQNLIATFIFAFIASVISLFFVKKNGNLI
ncbi:hypothetical protein EI427_21350 [Flammeovirga pectinis]|uniref:DUF4199 domain-containing protein n=1 Tax=Flammeovirga pectinis TaxID=2494373 RepID=A0A3S9P9D2_9BACT|nr:hypothetical protein [Flammeovirga pectinis]AZQ64774.1 hypothetical protein EI427_21350 [Flammeovirga pectinis]